MDDGALKETLHKHIIPTFTYFDALPKELHILDICFGLGYNTLATLYYIQKYHLPVKVNIYSPELDLALIHSLKDFVYPKEFDTLRHIIDALSRNLTYEDDMVKIEVAHIDAREYIRRFHNSFDIVYQDAFSSEKNRALWSMAYFADISNAVKEDAVMSTYSIASNVRYTMHLNNFYIYENYITDMKRSTLATTKKRVGCTNVDMALKIKNNPKLRAIQE